MTFDEAQAIWNSQQPPDGPLNREKVLLAVVRKARFFDRITTVTDVLMIATLLFVAAMFFRDPLLQGHDVVLIIPGVASLLAAAFVWKWRLNRLRRQSHFDDSLKGLIDRSIDTIDDRISHMQNFVWWFVCPNLLGLVIGLFIVDATKRYLLYSIFIPAFLACIGFAYWQIQREIRLKLEPERKALQTLQLQLASDE